MIVDVTNFENMVRGYVTKTINEYYSDLDTSKNSVFDDIFIKPIIELMTPFVQKISRLELKTNFSNFEYLTEDELDEIGENNYFMSRVQGTYATAVVTLVFTNVPVEDTSFYVKIPAGAVFATSSSLEFQTQTAITLSVTDFQNNYNNSKLIYEIDIPVTATGIGSSYNVYAGEINTCNTYFSSLLVSCENKSDVINGTDKETNADYAARIKEFYVSRQLGTAPGYKAFIRESFSEVTDIYVSGYRDEYMTRDLLSVYNESTQQVKQVHIGGKVDLYLKGCVYDQTTQYVTYAGNYIVLDCAYSDLQPDTYDIYNLTDGEKTPVIGSVSAGSDGKAVIILDNTSDQSYTSTISNNMKISYFYLSGGSYIASEKYFSIGITTSELSAPLTSIDSFIDESGNTLTGITHILNRTGIVGTTDENCSISIADTAQIANGSLIGITYTSNKTLRYLSITLNEDNNRIITTDVIGREAIAVPVNIQLSFKPSGSYSSIDSSVLENRIKTSIVSFFDNHSLGDSVEASDIVGWLYNDDSVKDIIQYIMLPFNVFYIPQDINEAIPTDGTQVCADGILNIKGIEYPILNVSKFKITAI